MLVAASRRRRSISSATWLAERAEAERELQVAVLLLGDDLERIGAELPLQALEVGAEYRAQHDLERELAHIVGEIDRLAARRLRGPALGEFLVDLVNQAAEPVDDAPVKDGLHHAPLAPPEVPLAGHDAVAEQDLDPVHALALGVVAMIRQQHVLDVVGMIDDVVVHAARRARTRDRHRRSARSTRAASSTIHRSRRGRSPRRAREEGRWSACALIVSQWPPRTVLRLAPRTGLPDNECRAEKTRRRPSQHPLRATNALGPAPDARTSAALQNDRAHGARPGARGVELVPSRARGRRREHRRGARARAVLHPGVLAPASALLRQAAARARACGREIGVPDQPLRRWRARRHDGAQARRAR